MLRRIKTIIEEEKPVCLCCIEPAFLRSLIGFPLERVTVCHITDQLHFCWQQHNVFICFTCMSLYLKTKKQEPRGIKKQAQRLAFTFPNMQIMLPYTKTNCWKIESGCVCDFKEQPWFVCCGYMSFKAVCGWRVEIG